MGRLTCPGKKVILTVGTDCAIGKMSVALELTRAADAAGLSSVLVPTGETGTMIAGWGVAVDRVISDFLNGTCEWLVEQGEALGDWVFVGGEGRSTPRLQRRHAGPDHGTTPHAMVMVHRVGLARHRSRPSARGLVPAPAATRLHPAAPTGCRARRALDRRRGGAQYLRLSAKPRRGAPSPETADLTGLPTDDPYRFGGERLMDALRERLS